MAHDETNRTDRRTFLQAGALATASGMSLAPGAGAQDAPAKARIRPRCCPSGSWARPGVEVTLLEQGATRGPSAERTLRFAFARGVRLFDTAKVYGTEANFKRWFEQDPAIRKQIVLVTKDMPREPQRLPEDGRPAAGGPGDRLHRLLLPPRAGGRQSRGSRSRSKFIKSREFREVADKIRSSGKAKVHRLLGPPSPARPAHPGGGRGRGDRRDHAPVPPLAGQGLAAEQGDRRGVEQGDRPDLDEADRQPGLRRQAQGRHPQGGEPSGCRSWPRRS